MTNPTIPFSLYADDEEDRQVQLPARWCICEACEGCGSSSAHLGTITQSDRGPGGDWEDPDEFAEYMAGAYDRPCGPCHGTGKVLVIDEECCPPDLLEAYRRQRDADLGVRAGVRGRAEDGA